MPEGKREAAYRLPAPASPTTMLARRKPYFSVPHTTSDISPDGTNNESEFAAVYHALHEAVVARKLKYLGIYTDSQFVVDCITGGVANQLTYSFARTSTLSVSYCNRLVLGK
jgi:ribonuclease HI